MARWILHADMDAFYASVEQRDFPELRGRPVIVGAGSARGVVAAASYEARRFGVRSAMPAFRARELCPSAAFVPGRMAVYAEVSRQIRDVFEEFTPLYEPLALDEAFLDITGCFEPSGGPEPLARALKQRVKEVTQLNVSVGLGPNKLVAKAACTEGKPNGLRVVQAADAAAFLAPFSVRRLWGVGPVMERRLQELGLHTIGQLARFDDRALKAALGDAAPALKERAQGIDASPVCGERQAKSCGEENTFETDVFDPAVVSAGITSHSEAVARRLRALGLKGRTVTLKAKLARKSVPKASRIEAGEEPSYPLVTRSRTLPAPTDDAAGIRRVALELWERAQIHEPIRLLGVSVSNLAAGTEPTQLELFGTAKTDALGPTLDEINARFGADSIRRAATAPKKLTPNLRKKD